MFGLFEGDWGWLPIECAENVISHTPYVGVLECTTSGKLRQLSGLSSSDIIPSASQIVSLIGHGESEVTGASGFNSFGENKSTIFKTNRSTLAIYLCLYELPLDTCRSGD